MNLRQEKILNTIIDTYIKTAEPVGSFLLGRKFALSSATIRNEMMALENEGLIVQPHISAGRVPTEKGYHYYINNFLKNKKKTNNNLNLPSLSTNDLDLAEQMKSIAKKTAELTEEAIVIAFNDSNVYCTGLSNLFSKPEFISQKMVCEVSTMIDELDEIIYNIYPQIGKDIQIIIGRENPFSDQCALVIGRWQFNSDSDGLFGILGPMRMNYSLATGIIEQVKNIRIN